MRILPICVWVSFLLVLNLLAQSSLPIPSDPNPNREPEFDEIVPVETDTEKNPTEALPEVIAPKPKDDGVRVSVLGYHEFSSDRPDTAMRIQTAKFRKQMEALRDLGHPIISMEQFIAWKNGQGELPPRCFLITIDDGWKSVYTDAYPILKELKFPFTIFLYKQYVDGGGRALTTSMINEMLESGLCTIGSHSVSHPFPSKFKSMKKKGEGDYLNFLNVEFGDSKKFLEDKFKKSVPTYAYPGGYYTDDMLPVAEKFGYQYLFTVNPGMTRIDTDNKAIPRHIILGNHDPSFELSTTFRSSSSANSNDHLGTTIQKTKHDVFPRPGDLIAERMPTIAAEFSKEPLLDPASLVMRVSGLGKVPAEWDEMKKTYSWTVNRPLRTPSCEVSIQWRLKDSREFELPMRWSFRIDLEAAYQPQ